MGNLLDSASIVLTPTAYDNGRMLSVKPNTDLFGAELLTQPVDLTTDFQANTPGTVIVDADTFTTSGGTFDGIKKLSLLTVGKKYRLVIEGDTTSSGFTLGSNAASGNEYGIGFGTHYFTAVINSNLWVRQQGTGTTNITSFSIKEDLSGDFDFSRNSAATRVNAQGLVENVQILSGDLVSNGDFSQEGAEEVSNGSFSQEGAEEITNGDFSDGSANWGNYITGSSTIVFTDVATLNIDASNSNVGIYQENVFTSGKQYKIVLKMKASSSFDAEILETQQASTISTIGSVSLTTSYQDFTFYFTATGSNDIFVHRKFNAASANQSITIDNVSVKEVLQDWSVKDYGAVSPSAVITPNTEGVKLEKTVSADWRSSFLVQPISYNSGSQYKVTFKLKNGNLPSGGSVYVRALYDSSSHTIVSNLTLTNDWVEYTYYYEADSNSLDISFGNVDWQNAGVGQYFYINDVSVKEVGQDWHEKSGVIVSVDSSGLVFDNSTGNDAAGVFQNIGLSDGKKYRMTATMQLLTGASNGNFALNSSTATGSGQSLVYLGATLVVGGDAVTETFDFTPASGDVSVQLSCFEANATFKISNISVIEITDDTNLPRINYEGFSYQDALGSELVTNGDFDVNGNWTNFGTPLVSEQSSTKYYTAPFSWYVNGDAYRQGIFSPNNFTLTNGKTYNVSLWVYALDGAEILSGLTNTDKSVFTSHAINQNEWTNITYSAIANATSASYISILTSSSTLEFYVDNVSVKEYLGQEVVPDSGCGSWLLEPQSTNLVPFSEDFSSGSWVKTNSSVVSGFASPSGILNAFKLINDATASVNKYIRTIPSATSGTDYSLSLFAKKGEYDKLRIEDGNNSQGAWFDLSNGTLGTVGGSVVAKIEDYGNGWYRCSITKPSITTNIFFAIVGSNIENIQVGDGTSGVYIWGAMLEQQSYATSYIPTNGAISTRLQDIANNSGNATLINSTEGVLYAEIAALEDLGTARRYISLSDGSSNNDLRLYFNNSVGTIVALSKVGGVTQFSMFGSGYDLTEAHKIAVKYKVNDFALWVDGVEVATDSSGSVNAANTFNELAFNGNSLPFFGKAKAVVVYKEALTDEQLTCLTTI